MALHRRCMSRGRGGCGWRGCSGAGAGRQFLSSGMSPPSPSLLRSSISPSPATCSSSRAGSSGAQHGLCLPPTAQLIPTDALGVSRWREVPRNPIEPRRCQQRHQDCGNRLDQADTGAAVLGRETQRPPFRPRGGQGEPRAHPMASLAARTHECPWFVNLVLVLQEHPHPQHPRRERAQGRPRGPPRAPGATGAPTRAHAGTPAPLDVTVGGPCHARLAALCRSASQKPHSCELGRPPDLASSGSEWL